MAGPLTFLTLFERRAFFGQKNPHPESHGWNYVPGWPGVFLGASGAELQLQLGASHCRDSQSQHVRHRSAARMPHSEVST